MGFMTGDPFNTASFFQKVSPAAAAAAASGLQTTALTSAANAVTQAASTSVASVPVNAAMAKDQRVRIAPIATQLSQDQVYGPADPSNLLTPLRATQGMMYPYSPQISVQQDVSYKDISLTHANGDYLAYERTPSVSLTIAGKFTCQTQTDGLYALACIHFLRVCSKMYFGDNYNGAANPYIGLPPPILTLNGYGTYMFNNLRVVLKSHQFNYDQQMDLVKIVAPGGNVWLPAMFELSCTLMVQQTPNMQRTQFDLGKFRTGALMQGNGGWI
jgi:hypothetical protein